MWRILPLPCGSNGVRGEVQTPRVRRTCFRSAATTSGHTSIIRPSVETHGAITLCDFRNNAFGVVTSGNGASDFNLGTATTPGENNFCIDYSLFPDIIIPPDVFHTDPYRVALYDRLPGVFDAVGNWWIRGNQSADATGVMTITSAGPMPGGVNEPPPGPLDGQVDDTTGLPWLRNFSIRMNSGSINFGVGPPPGTAPDCAVDP